MGANPAGFNKELSTARLVGDDFHQRNSLVQTPMDDTFNIPTFVGFKKCIKLL